MSRSTVFAVMAITMVFNAQAGAREELGDSESVTNLKLLSSLCSDIGGLGNNQLASSYLCYTTGIRSIVEGDLAERLIFKACTAAYTRWFSTAGPRECLVKGMRHLNTPDGQAVIEACAPSFVSDDRRDELGYQCVRSGFIQAFLR